MENLLRDHENLSVSDLNGTKFDFKRSHILKINDLKLLFGSKRGSNNRDIMCLTRHKTSFQFIRTEKYFTFIVVLSKITYRLMESRHKKRTEILK